MPGQVRRCARSIEQGKGIESSCFIESGEIGILAVAQRQHVPKERLSRCLELIDGRTEIAPQGLPGGVSELSITDIVDVRSPYSPAEIARLEGAEQRCGSSEPVEIAGSSVV